MKKFSPWWLLILIPVAYIGLIAYLVHNEKPPERELGKYEYRYANDRSDVPYTHNQYGYCKTYIK